jgi:uncharacterized membrane protein HdeD (DUF308 family)
MKTGNAKRARAREEVDAVLIVVPDWKSLALRGMAALALGVLTFAWPGITLAALVLLFGAYALIDGFSTIIGVIRRRPDVREHRAVFVLQGLAGIGAGIVTFLWPSITALALLLVIAAWAFTTGVLQIAAAVRMRRVIDNEWFLGLVGVLGIAFAVVAVINPAAGALGVTWAIAWYASFMGVLLLALAWRVRKLESEAQPRSRGYAARRPRAA